MGKINKVKIIRIFLLTIAVVTIIGIIVYLFPLMKDISTRQGQIEFKEKIDSLGMYGFLALFALQLAQIFLIVLPGEPLEILAGMCYGEVWGTIFILTTVCITTTAIFLLVRKYGKDFIYQSFSKEKIDKIENSKLFKNTKTVEWIMIILFLIPGTPKDLLVYIGGILPIKPIRFIFISTFMRFPSVISSTIAGANLVEGNFKNMVFAYGVTFLVTGIVVFIVNKMDKRKITKEALQAIK